MCFSPKISLITALAEFIIAALIFVRAKGGLIKNYVVVFILFLGLYQLTEFLLCVSGEPQLWGTLGFLTYTFLPALGLDFVVRCLKLKHKYFNWILYLPAVIFSLIAVFTENFIVDQACTTVFVEIQNTLFQSDLMFVYWLYYALYLLAISFILIKIVLSSKNKREKKLALVTLVAVLLSLLPALILIIVFPALGIMFPSIYCEFALLFAIFAVIVLWYEER